MLLLCPMVSSEMGMTLREHQRLVNQVITELNIRSVRDKAVHTVGFLLESDPELLERIRRQAGANDEESRLWSRIFTGYSSPTVGDDHEWYRNWLLRMVETASFAIAICDRLEGTPATPEELDFILNNEWVKEICRGRELDINLAKAAMLVSALGESAPVITDVLKESAGYVVNHLDAVLALLPELARRQFITKDEIAILVEGGHSSMSSGQL